MYFVLDDSNRLPIFILRVYLDMFQLGLYHPYQLKHAISRVGQGLY